MAQHALKGLHAKEGFQMDGDRIAVDANTEHKTLIRVPRPITPEIQKQN